MKIAGLYPQPVDRGPHGEIEFLEPLGLEYILAQVADEHEVKLFTLFDGTAEQTAQKIEEYKPDVLAVSAMTPQINLGLKMAGMIKRKLPDVTTVFGGYHPTAIPSIVSMPEVDAVIAGEGEIEFERVINNSDHGKEKIIIRADRIKDLDSIKDPLRPDFIEKLRDHGHRYPPALEQTGMASLLYSRGCLFNCEFCSSPAMYGAGVSYRSVERVVSELAKLNKERGINAFFFSDLNFTANPNKTRELCNAIINSGMQFYWECLSNVSTAQDPELLKLMHRAGCRKIGWGIESLSPEVIKAMGKSGLERTHEVLQASENAGIVNTGFYIIGHPTETGQDILESSRGLADLPIHRLRFTVNTPLPGSRLYNQTTEKSPDFDLYDTTHLVFNHPNLSQHDLDMLRAQITERFYESAVHGSRLAKFVANFPEYEKVFGKSSTLKTS